MLSPKTPQMLSNLHSNVANREIRTNSMSSNPSPVLLPSSNPPNSLHSKIIMAALAMLCLVVVFTLGLHIYAKFFWRRSTRRLALWRRRQGLEFQGGEEPAQIGLEKAVVDSLPTFVYKLSPAQTETLECAVCLCEFQDNDKGRLLPKCSHSFHTDCIDMWFLSHTTCPLCRTSAEPVGQSEDVFMGSSSAFLLGQSTGNDLQEFEQIGGGTLQSENGDGDANPNGSPLHDDRSFSSSIQQSVGWSWRRSTSDRSPQSPGVQFPTNVLFWGDHAHVNSRVSPSPRLEHGQSGGRSLPHIVIEIPRRQQNLLTLRSVSPAPSRCSSIDDQSCPSPTGQQPSKSPGVRFNAFKRLLTKESKIFPAEQDMSSCSGQSGATVSTA